jgi:hypothetical protein
VNEKAPVSLKDTTGTLRTLEDPYRPLLRLTTLIALNDPSGAA